MKKKNKELIFERKSLMFPDFRFYDSSENTVDYIHWLGMKGGWDISDKIYLKMDDENPEDIYVEVRDSETDKLIERLVDSSEEVIEWLDENNYIID